MRYRFITTGRGRESQGSVSLHRFEIVVLEFEIE